MVSRTQWEAERLYHWLRGLEEQWLLFHRTWVPSPAPIWWWCAIIQTSLGIQHPFLNPVGNRNTYGTYKLTQTHTHTYRIFKKIIIIKKLNGKVSVSPGLFTFRFFFLS